MKNPIYLDNNSTTAVDPEVLEEMLPYFTKKYGNASSHQHAFGWIAEDGLELASERITHLLGCEIDEFIYTSGATESINLILKGLWSASGKKKAQILTLPTEHSAVLEPLLDLENEGLNVCYLRIHENGLIDLNDLESALKKETLLVCIMLANNETGLIQPIREISKLVHEYGSFLFTDATQAFGKIPISVEDSGIDLLACSAHKIYGPKGVGGLYIRKKNPFIKIKGQILGGGQQGGIRSGTLNIPGIIGFGKAASIAEIGMSQEAKFTAGMRDYLENKILELPDTHINGSKEFRLPNTTNIRLDSIRAEQIFAEIPEIALSTGSACNSANPEPSHVLKAMGLTEKQTKSSIRIGVGRFNTPEEMKQAGEAIQNAVVKLRGLIPW